MRKKSNSTDPLQRSKWKSLYIIFIRHTHALDKDTHHTKKSLPTTTTVQETTIMTVRCSLWTSFQEGGGRRGGGGRCHFYPYFAPIGQNPLHPFESQRHPFVSRG